MQKLVDVVIPMYNRAHCITGLIEELKSQTMQDFCAIFVDDGSTDNSYQLLEAALKDVPFAYKLIKKENGGAASARNAGLRASTGTWIAFVDSDDRMKPHYLEYLVRAVVETDADLGVCYYQAIVEGKNTTICDDEPFSCQVLTPAECMRLYFTKWLGVPCLLVSGKLIREKNLYMDEQCSYCEDGPYVANVIESSTKVAYVDQQLYLYYTYQGSLSRSPSVEKFISGIEAFRRLERYMASRDSEAAKLFGEMGKVRYYVAVCRKAAVQMSYDEFFKLERIVNFKQYADKLHHLGFAQKLAGYALCISKPLFYYTIKFLFRD